MFGEAFNPGNWRSGVVRLDSGAFVLLVTLSKEDLDARYAYADRFLDTSHFVWISQHQMRRDDQRSLKLRDHEKLGIALHLFVRHRKKRPDSTAEPFYSAGEVTFERWEEDAPITVWFSLPEPVPASLHALFEVPSLATPRSSR